MSEYFISIFAVCLVGGVAILLSHSNGSGEKMAVGIVTLYVIISPLIGYISEFNAEEWLGSIKNEEFDTESEYNAVMEDAFGRGIALAVAEKFSLDSQDIRIRLYGFDPEKMNSEKIRVILSGKAALSDYKAVEKYVDSLNLGECDVEIEIK